MGSSPRTLNVSGLTGNATYPFTVQAGDAAGNWSATGPTFSVSTPPLITAQLQLVAPTTVDWASTYTVAATLTNTGQVDIVSAEMSLYQNGSLVTPDPMTIGVAIAPLGSKKLTWPKFKKDWQWWKDPEVYEQLPPPAHLPGPLSRDYSYHVTVTWVDANQGVHTARSPSAGDSVVTVVVPQWKRDDAAWAYRFGGTGLGLSAVGVIGGAFNPLIGAAAAAGEAAAYYGYSDAFERLQDPPEMDQNFRILAQLPDLPLSLPTSDDPLVKAFCDAAYSTRDFGAALTFFNVSRRRAWTAFANDEEGCVHQQVAANAAARDACLNAAATLSGHLRILADALEAAGLTLTSDQVALFQQQVRERGLPPEETVLLQQWGVSSAIGHFTQLTLALDATYASYLPENLREQAAMLAMMAEPNSPPDHWFDEVQQLGEVHSVKGRQQLLFAAGFLTLEEIDLGRTKIIPWYISPAMMRFLPTGEFQLEVSGGPGHVFVLERSTDLQTWSVVSTGQVPASGVVTVQVLPCLPLIAEFFRCAEH